MMRAIHFDNTQEWWVLFVTWLITLPEAQVPEAGEPCHRASGEDAVSKEKWDEHMALHTLSFDHHGLFFGGDEYNITHKPAAKKASDNDKALHFSRLAGGLLEHGWHDGIPITTNLLAAIIDAWYKNFHSHAETSAKNTVSGRVFKVNVAA